MNGPFTLICEAAHIALIGLANSRNRTGQALQDARTQRAAGRIRTISCPAAEVSNAVSTRRIPTDSQLALAISTGGCDAIPEGASRDFASRFVESSCGQYLEGRRLMPTPSWPRLSDEQADTPERHNSAQATIDARMRDILMDSALVCDSARKAILACQIQQFYPALQENASAARCSRTGVFTDQEREDRVCHP